MSTLLTLPQTAFAAGANGQTVAVSVPTGLSLATALITQVAWPYSGTEAVSFEIDASMDSGNTWTLLVAGAFLDAPVLGPSTTQMSLTCSLPNPASTTRKVRMSWNFAKALTVLGTVTGV